MSIVSQRMRMSAYLRDEYGVEPEYLWSRYPNYAVFRHPTSQKWFAVMMDVPKNKLGFADRQPVDVLNVKSDPLLVGALLSEPGFLPAYHMNKETWISILLDGSVPDHTIFPLLELSYNAVSAKRKRRAQEDCR